MCQGGKGYSLWLVKGHEKEHPLECVEAFHRRPLKNAYKALMVDGVVLARKTGARAQEAGAGALGSRHDGKKEIIDFQLASSESAAEWERFLTALHRRKAENVARRLADRWQPTYPKALACLSNDLDDLLTCFRYNTLAERKQIRTTNAIERRFREVRRRTRPTGTFQDKTSMDRILYAVFIHENKSQGISTPVSLTHNS